MKRIIYHYTTTYEVAVTVPDEVEDLDDRIREGIDYRINSKMGSPEGTMVWEDSETGEMRAMPDARIYAEEIDGDYDIVKIEPVVSKGDEPPRGDYPAGVWVLVTPDATAESTEVEIFGERPKTPGELVDTAMANASMWNERKGNWPSTYWLYAGNINGGDSVLIEEMRDGTMTYCAGRQV